MSEQQQLPGQPPPPEEPAPQGAASIASFGAQGEQPPYEPVPVDRLPGTTHKAMSAALSPMQVTPEVAANPWSDPAAVQNMMLAAQGLKEFDQFVARNNVARLVPGKRVKGFLRVPNGLVQSQGVLTPGLTLDRTIGEAVAPSDIYVPVMDGEDDRSAYERYQKDLSKWNGSLLPFRWANWIADRAIPFSAEATAGNYFAGMIGQIGLPLALDDLRKHVARNAPVYGLERFDTESDLASPDWSWAVFGGAMKGGSEIVRTGMLRFLETGPGQAFMRGMQKAGVGALAEAGTPLAGEGLLGAPMGKSSQLFEWLGNRVGSKAFSKVSPETFKRAEQALRSSGAKLRVTADGIDIGFSEYGPASMGELTAALRALKAEMSEAGEKAMFRIFTDVPSTFGGAAGGALAGGAVAADPLAQRDLTPEQRKLIAQGIPAAMVIGGAIPLGMRAVHGALDFFKAPPHQKVFDRGPYRPQGVDVTKYLTDIAPAPEPPPRTFGQGPGPAGPPPTRPGPTGPMTPDSGIYSMPLTKIPSVETNGAMQTPAAEQFSIQESVRTIEKVLPAVQDPKQLFEARKFMDAIAAEQTQMVAAMDNAGVDPAVMEGRNKAVASKLEALNRLLGKDLTPTTFALGLPAESMLFDATILPETTAIEPLRMGLLTWAHGLGVEAGRVGVDLATVTAALPPPGSPWDLQTISARLQNIAQQVKMADPGAAVGPPNAMTPDIPLEIRKGRPVQVEPIAPVELPEPQSITKENFPTASELRSDPGAVRRQTYSAARIASGMRFHVGDLVPSNPSGLRDMDPVRVPVFQDSAGRLMARTPAHEAPDAEIEITDDIGRLALPADAGWEFAQNPLAPIPYTLDAEQELLTVDPLTFEARQWARDAYKEAVWDTVQGEMGKDASPTANPVNMVSAIRTAPPQSIDDANGLLDQINKMQAEHEGKRPTAELAKSWAGPGADKNDIFRVHHEMLKEYAGMGALLEAARADVLGHKVQLEMTQDMLRNPVPTTLTPHTNMLMERHARGPAIYSRMTAMLLNLDPAAKWEPDTLMRRLNADGMSLEDLEISDVKEGFVARAAGARPNEVLVYHQTGAENEPSIREKGFSTDPGLAKQRSGDGAVPGGIFFKPTDEDIFTVKGWERGPQAQIPVYLSLRSPLVVKDKTEIVAWARKLSPEYADLRDNPVRDGWKLQSQILDKLLAEQGHDGVIIENDVAAHGRSTKTYIALKPSQVRLLDPTRTPGTLTAKEAIEVVERRGGEAFAETILDLIKQSGPFMSMMARGSEGDARAQTRFDPKLIGALGASQYQGNLGPVVVKELLQNAKDGLMAAIEQGWNRSEKPVLKVFIENEGGKNRITVEDNGIGMNPNVAAKEFVEIGGTYKPGTSASGGFGMAKIAYLPNAKSINVRTVNDTPYGRVATSLTGTGEEWADPNRGLPMRVTPAEAWEEPGLKISLDMDPLADMASWEANNFINEFGRNSDLPFEFQFKRNGERISIDPRERSELLTLNAVGADVSISDFSGGKTKEGRSTLHIGNNGIFQFSMSLWSTGTVFPEELWINVKPTVAVDSPHYPFTTNREALKQSLLRFIEGRIVQDISSVLRSRQRDFFTKILNEAPRFLDDPKYRVVDTMQNIPQNLIESIQGNPKISGLFTMLGRHSEKYLSLLNSRELDPPRGYYQKINARFYGLGISGKYHGCNILGQAINSRHNFILVNPFVSYIVMLRYVQARVADGVQVPLAMKCEMLAGSIQATIIHELTHQQVRSDESAEFGGALTKNLGTLAHANSRFTMALAKALEANDGDLLYTISNFATDLESYWATGEDALESISAHSRKPPEPRDDSSSPPDRGGRGSGERGSVRGGPQDASSPVDPSADVPGGRAQKEEAEAKLRAEALARIVSGDGWSGKRGPKLFAALTDAERTDALASRIATGKFVNRKHLMAMSPQKWEATGKFPKYFGDWRPTPGQMTALKDTFNERLEQFNKSEATLAKIITAAKPTVPGGRRPPMLALKDILGIDPTHLEELVKDPHTFDEWVRQFYRSVDPIYNDPEVQAQRDVRQQIDLLKDAVRTMGDTRVLAGVHPYDEPPTAFGALTRLTAWAHNQQAIMQGRVRMLGRPSYVIGWRKQITHPAEWNENKEELSRNVYHILYSAYLHHAQELEGHINKTATLNQAASQWMSAKAPIFDEPAELDINAPPPKSMTPSVILDRAIATFLDQRPSSMEIAKSQYRYHEVKIGLVGKAKIDLAVEMPKLYRIYDDLITKAEQAMILKNRTESVRYKAKGEALEGELRARILRLARREFPEADYQSFDQLGADNVIALTKALRATDIGNRGADPMSIGARSFKSVEAGWRAALRQYEKRKDMIVGIQNGDLRREGYYTAVHKMTVDEVRNMLRDPQSIWSRYTTPDVRNYFLNERKSDKEPYRSWAVGWTFYLPAMLRTIHLEPALINVVPKIQQLPADLREYADQVVRQMKGDLDQTDRVHNQLAMASWAENPTLSSEMSRWAGTDHIERLRNDPEARMQLVGSKPWTQFVEGAAGATYLALMSPLKVAKMTVTELAFWSREMMKRPQDSFHLAAFGAAGLGRAGFEGVRELASWLHSFAYGGPRWYSEATLMKVTDSLNELALERHQLPTHLDVPAKLFKSAVQTWYGVMRSTEYSLRASTYYALKLNALRFGLEEDEARELAARMTNDLIGAFGPLETTPTPRGTTGRAVFQFKRFLAAKTDLLIGDMSNSTRLFMPTRDLNLALGHGGGNPPPDTPLGLATQAAAPAGGGPPPPPPLTNSSFGEWTPDERNSWDKYAEPVAHMGSSFASSRTAQMRSFLAFLGLLAAAYPTIGFIAQFAKLFWQDDDPNAPGQSILDMVFPWDFRRINSIPALWWVEYLERIALLEAKQSAPFTGGLNAREERELKIRKQTMVEALWPVGQVLKQRRYDEQQRKYDEDKQKKQMHNLNRRPSPPRRPRPGAPQPQPAPAQ